MDQPITASAANTAGPKGLLPPCASPAVLAGAVLMLCLTLTWQVWHGAYQSQEAERRTAFALRAREAVSALSQRVTGYVQLLKGMQGLFASSQLVTRTEFADFVFAHDLDQQLPGVQAIGFMAAVTATERASHVAKVRSEGVLGYTVWPPGERGVYAPITYIEPLKNANARALGFDGWSDPVRRAMLEQARDSGQPAMSGPLKLLQEDQGRPLAGFVIALPVYRNGLARMSIEQRRAALTGWVVAPFSAAEVLAGLDRLHTDGLRLELIEGAGALAPDAGRTSVHSVAIGPQRLQVRISESAPGEQHVDWMAPTAIGLFGLAVTAALSLLTWMLAHSSVAAKCALAQARTLAHELESGRQQAMALADAAHLAQSMMRSILDASTEGILVDDCDGRILVSNQRFRTLWGVPPQLDMQGRDLALLEHMTAQLAHPGDFLHAHSLPCPDAHAQTAALQFKDSRLVEQTVSAVRLGSSCARLWSYRDVTECNHQHQQAGDEQHNELRDGDSKAGGAQPDYETERSIEMVRPTDKR